MAGRLLSNQHRLWSLSSSLSAVIIAVVGIDCGHRCCWPWSSSSSTLSVVIVVTDIDCGHRRCRPWSLSTIMESRSIVIILLSLLSEVMRLRATLLPSKAGVVIVHHHQQHNPGRGVRPMVVWRSLSSNWVKGLVVAEQVKCPLIDFSKTLRQWPCPTPSV